MQIRLNFVTPLWTADASKAVHRVQVTGLLGSLRWWYEALVRGLGGYACDPTGEQRCAVESGLCAACQVFGATGQAKAFRLSATTIGMKLQRPYALDTDTVTSKRPSKAGQAARYYFPAGLQGPVALTILPRQRADEATPVLLVGVLEFIRRYAALGAKTNLGYGLFEWQAPPPGLAQAAELAQQLHLKEGHAAHNQPLWPDLQRMFFATVTLPASWDVVKFVDFKHDLREAVRNSPEIQKAIPNEKAQDRLRHFLLGTVQENPNQASKIKMALAPGKPELRVWGWIPTQLPGGLKRDIVLDLLYGQLGALGSLRWREFAAARDPHPTSDPAEFLNALMQPQAEGGTQ